MQNGPGIESCITGGRVIICGIIVPLSTTRLSPAAGLSANVGRSPEEEDYLSRARMAGMMIALGELSLEVNMGPTGLAEIALERSKGYRVLKRVVEEVDSTLFNSYESDAAVGNSAGTNILRQAYPRLIGKRLRSGFGRMSYRRESIDWFPSFAFSGTPLVRATKFSSGSGSGPTKLVVLSSQEGRREEDRRAWQRLIA